MNRRAFIGKAVILSAGIFIPKLIKPVWKRTVEPYGVRLIKGMPHTQEAFARFIGPVIKEVLSQAGTAPLIYRDFTFNSDSSHLPLDLHYGPMPKRGLIVDNNI